MKATFVACGAAAVLLLAGCATEVRTIPLTGNMLVDGPRAIAEGPPRDKVLWQYQTGLAALRQGEFLLSKAMFDEALRTLGGIYGKDASAQKARSYFTEENKKKFIGEPYERVMAYYYRGILYWMDGEPDNARACFRSGQIEDSSSIGERFIGDYVLLDYLDGLATVKLAGDGEDAYKRSLASCKNFRTPPPYDPQANVLFFVEFGPPPLKYASGEYGQELHFMVAPSPVASALIRVDNQIIGLGPFDDLGFQATTRGGRVMDHVLANKAVFKKSTDVVGTAGIITGAVMAGSHDQTTQQVGWGILAAGILSKIIAESTTPAADVRVWRNLPRYLSFAAVELAPGEHTVTVEFQGRGGLPLPNLTKNLTINVPADKRDKVVFVSDTSLTPQTL